MMNVAIPTWSGRVSPVLDTAGRLLVIRADAGQEIHRQETALTADDLPARVEQIAGMGLDILICGAVSQVLEDMLVRRGIRVIPHVCGDVEEVLRCYLSGKEPQERFSMPGCCRRRRQRGGRSGGPCHRRWQRPV